MNKTEEKCKLAFDLQSRIYHWARCRNEISSIPFNLFVLLRISWFKPETDRFLAVWKSSPETNLPDSPVHTRLTIFHIVTASYISFGVVLWCHCCLQPIRMHYFRFLFVISDWVFSDLSFHKSNLREKKNPYILHLSNYHRQSFGLFELKYENRKPVYSK